MRPIADAVVHDFGNVGHRFKGGRIPVTDHPQKFALEAMAAFE